MLLIFKASFTKNPQQGYTKDEQQIQKGYQDLCKIVDDNNREIEEINILKNPTNDEQFKLLIEKILNKIEETRKNIVSFMDTFISVHPLQMECNKLLQTICDQNDMVQWIMREKCEDRIEQNWKNIEIFISLLQNKFFENAGKIDNLIENQYQNHFNNIKNSQIFLSFTNENMTWKVGNEKQNRFEESIDKEKFPEIWNNNLCCAFISYLMGVKVSQTAFLKKVYDTYKEFFKQNELSSKQDIDADFAKCQKDADEIGDNVEKFTYLIEDIGTKKLKSDNQVEDNYNKIDKKIEDAIIFNLLTTGNLKIINNQDKKNAYYKYLKELLEHLFKKKDQLLFSNRKFRSEKIYKQDLVLQQNSPQIQKNSL